MSTSGSANYVLLTRLADEFAARYRAGEQPALQEYMCASDEPYPPVESPSASPRGLGARA